jgi:hypothetical protein
MRFNYWDAKWTGRKNFKVFVKTNNNSNVARNNNFLQTHTRNYVPMELIDLDKIKKKGTADDEMLESNEAHNLMEQKQHRDTQRRQTSSSNLQQQRSAFNVREEALFLADSDSDNEEAAGTAAFQFTTDIDGVHNNDGLGMQVRVLGDESGRGVVPEFRRINEHGILNEQIDNEAARAVAAVTNSRVNTPVVSLEGEDDEDDDDDDDTPKFRFRSR